MPIPEWLFYVGLLAAAAAGLAFMYWVVGSIVERIAFIRRRGRG